MNIYEKLSSARLELQGMNIKQSGMNKFAGYSYYELSDFLPVINTIFEKLKLCSIVSFSAEYATLTLVNMENPDETIVFTSPMASAALKGCHEIQNMGAVETYSRRYLYVTALEIVEHDALDSTQGKPDNKPIQKASSSYVPVSVPVKGVISEAQVKRLYAIGRGQAALSKKIIQSHGFASSKDITTAKYDVICQEIETAKAEAEAQEIFSN